MQIHRKKNEKSVHGGTSWSGRLVQPIANIQTISLRLEAEDGLGASRCAEEAGDAARLD